VQQRGKPGFAVNVCWHGVCEKERAQYPQPRSAASQPKQKEDDMNLADISKLGVANPFKQRYDNYIGGKFVAPVKGEYFANVTPITGQPFCEVARSTAEDVELALDAAHAAKDAWGKTSPAERAAS
jgi:hypothetical protein